MIFITVIYSFLVKKLGWNRVVLRSQYIIRHVHIEKGKEMEKMDCNK